MHQKNLTTFLFLCVFFIHTSKAQSVTDQTLLDVQSYHVELKPNIANKYIEGNVIIVFSVDPSAEQVTFNCGNLKVIDVKGDIIKSFQQKDQELQLVLSGKSKKSTIQVQISYKGSPSKGLIFLPDLQQAYTVYSTNEWMVCNPSPDDRASIKIDIILPAHLSSIASGILIQKQERENNTVMYSWVQESSTPAYTYGFVIGSFNEGSEKHHNIALNYYSHKHSPLELKQIFDKTGDMISFFEEKSGIPYFQTVYSQILIGNHYQEMSGLAVLKSSYGEMVLKDSTETNLISHELAHQWWGNMITCQSWNHFWLNEGFATYMSAAYNEYRFGKEKYLADINAYYKVYEKVKANGNDKPLVFKDWANPTPQDRNIVYFKSAYVLHLLREELGDEAFWKAIKLFSTTYYGKSVTSKNLQDSIEASSGKNLSAFFNKWIY